MKAAESDKAPHIIRHRFDLAMAQGQVFAGVDEVGRGCLAGPVFAAAILLPPDIQHWCDVNDSKKLSEVKRQKSFEIIVQESIAIGIGQAVVSEIDQLNILRATQLAMGRAIGNLNVDIDLALVDGNVPANSDVPSLPVVAGDARSLSIAAASIVAKVHRDRYMRLLHKEFPEYHFDKNVGYGTPAHLDALAAFGPTSHHRKSFAPVRDYHATQVRLAING